MFDLIPLIKAAGYIGLFGIVFAESGLFFGFFFPGDSLLFTAGFLASQGFLHIGFLLVVCFAGAVLGDSVGYMFGRKVGPKIFTREDSLLFHKHHLVRAEQFYNKYGAKTIILARFVPVVRTFAPILAGVGRMQYREFLVFNVVGGALWSLGLPFIGYYLGAAIPGVDKYILPIVLGIILISISPIAWHIIRDPEHRIALVKFLRNKFSKGS
ncbi:MAG: VTT domain-containing protein [bacterium]|nr:VTT domain-containing protein [bacterium]